MGGANTSGDNSRSLDSMISIRRGATPFVVASTLKSRSESLALSMYFAGFLISFWAENAKRSARVIFSSLGWRTHDASRARKLSSR